LKVIGNLGCSIFVFRRQVASDFCLGLIYFINDKKAKSPKSKTKQPTSKTKPPTSKAKSHIVPKKTK